VAGASAGAGADREGHGQPVVRWVIMHPRKRSSPLRRAAPAIVAALAFTAPFAAPRQAAAQQQQQADLAFLRELATSLEVAATSIQTEAAKAKPSALTGQSSRDYDAQTQWLSAASSRCAALAKAIRDKLRADADGTHKLLGHEATHVVQQGKELQKELSSEAEKTNATSTTLKVRKDAALAALRSIRS
jgi:hypothetical protein